VRRCVLKYEIFFKKDSISPSSKVPYAVPVPCFLKCSKAGLWIRICFNADLYLAFYFNTDPDPGSQTNADPDPGQSFKSLKIEFLHEKKYTGQKLTYEGKKAFL
jgi:hypothetical protein